MLAGGGSLGAVQAGMLVELIAGRWLDDGGLDRDGFPQELQPHSH